MNILSKKIAYTLLIILATGFYSCSSDDDNSSGCVETIWYQDLDGDGLGNPSITISSCDQPDGYVDNNNDNDDSHAGYYTNLPLTIGSTWSYDVSTNDGTNITNSTDIITADTNVTIGAFNYTDLSMSQGSTGIMSTMLDQNNFRTADGVDYMKGELILPLSQLGGTDLAIFIDDAELTNQSKNNGDILSQQPGNTSQTIQGYELDITYNLKTIQREYLSNHTVGSNNYSDVTKADIIITAQVSTSIDVLGNQITVPLLASQDIYTITNYYANEIGLIDSDAVFTYTLEDFSSFGITLPIPSSSTVTTTQKITAYTIN